MEGAADQTTKALSELAMDSSTTLNAAESSAGDGAGPRSKKYVFVWCYYITLRFLCIFLRTGFDCSGCVEFFCSALKKEQKMKQKEEEKRRKDEEKAEKAKQVSTLLSFLMIPNILYILGMSS